VLAAISKGKVQYEKSPNIRNALGEVPHIEHRLLQPIAHLTGKGLGQSWAVKSDENTDIYLSRPTSIPGLATRLLDARCFLLCHLFLHLQSFLLPIETPKAEEHLRKALERIGDL